MKRYIRSDDTNGPMTIDEAIERIQQEQSYCDFDSRTCAAFGLAIEALKRAKQLPDFIQEVTV